MSSSTHFFPDHKICEKKSHHVYEIFKGKNICGLCGLIKKDKVLVTFDNLSKCANYDRNYLRKKRREEKT